MRLGASWFETRRLAAGRAAVAAAAARLYRDLVLQARSPGFYRELGVPDTPEGRFEMIGLHAALIIDEAEDSVFSKTDWVIVTRDKALVENEAIAQKTSAIDAIPGLRLWTDDFNNLYQILK